MSAGSFTQCVHLDTASNMLSLSTVHSAAQRCYAEYQMSAMHHALMVDMAASAHVVSGLAAPSGTAV